MSASIEIVRSGTALRRGNRLVRRVQLASLLGDARPRGRRFASANLAGDMVELEMTDGWRETIPASVFEPSRQPELVVEGAGRVMTADGPADDPLGIVDDGAVVAGGGRVLWIGPRAELAKSGLDLSRARRVDAGGRLVTPGLIDCHAHPMFAGNRANEFAMRAEGKGYLEIAEAGGGIAATLGPTREAGFDDHVELTFGRMTRALAAGTTTCEAKSGYDLTVDGELRLLEVAQAVDSLHLVDVDPTLLGAHLVPPERRADRAGYVADVAGPMLEAVIERKLARAVDVYCDTGAFTLDETRTILSAARKAGLIARAHVGQFSDLGGPQLLAEIGGTSADHLEFVSDDGMRAMASHGIVAVMLPGACVQLRQDPPPVAKLREAGVTMAVATDMNPGTTMGETLPIHMWLATTHYGMTVQETWLGVTKNAARAMGRHDIGILSQNAVADMVIWDAEAPEEIPYRYDVQMVARVIKRGRLVATRTRAV